MATSQSQFTKAGGAQGSPPFQANWSKPDLISSLQGVLVLDGLDTSKLHDERSGVMAPFH